MMKVTNHLHIRALLGLPIAAFLGGCLMDAPAPVAERPVPFVLEIRLGAAGEANPMVVDTTAGRLMEVTLASSAGDTLRDTITALGSRRSLERAFLARTNAAQVVRARYSLASGRRWRASVRVADPRDSVWYQGAGESVFLRPFGEGVSGLSLSPRYLVRGTSLSLPERVGGRRICFSRVTLEVDGRVVRDTAASRAEPARGTCGDGSGTFFPAGKRASAVAVSASYFPVRAGDVVVRAHGYLEGDTVGTGRERLLYEGGRSEDGTGNVAADVPFVLAWKAAEAAAPDAGTVGLVIKFGQVNTVTLNAQISGELSF